MYLPQAFAVEDRQAIREALQHTGFGHLVTTSSEDGSGLTATALPFLVDDELTELRAHFSRANRHWRSIDGLTGLMIVPVVDAYVSPRWYPGKLEHGNVVPTWNYELIHLHGTIEIQDDPASALAVVRQLTDEREAQLDSAQSSATHQTWSVDDAPDEFIANQLKAIVGVRLRIEKVDAKRKLSQNRNGADRAGATEGLASSNVLRDQSTAARMKATANQNSSG